MSTEAARVGQMIYAVKQQRGTIFEWKTDSVLYALPKRCKDCLPELTFKDLHLRSRFQMPKQRALDQHFTPALVDSDALVFRAQDALEKDLLRAETTNWPERHGTYEHTPIVWRDLSEEEATRRPRRREQSSSGAKQSCPQASGTERRSTRE